MSEEGVPWRCRECRCGMYTPRPWQYYLCLSCMHDSKVYRCDGGYALLVVPVPLESKA